MNRGIDYENLRDEDCRLIQVISWNGRVVKRFDGKLFLINEVHVANTQNGERMIIFKELEGDCRLYAEPAKEFMRRTTKEELDTYNEEYKYKLFVMGE